jgi:hypothetical protein
VISFRPEAFTYAKAGKLDVWQMEYRYHIPEITVSKEVGDEDADFLFIVPPLQSTSVTQWLVSSESPRSMEHYLALGKANIAGA